MISFKTFINEKYIMKAIGQHLRAVDKEVTSPINISRQKAGKPLLTKAQKVGIHAGRIATLAAGTAATGAIMSNVMGGTNVKPGVIAGASLAAAGSLMLPHVKDIINFRNKLKQMDSK